MSRSIANKFVALSIQGFLFLGAVPATGQETASAKQQSPFAIVHDLLQASYPEMFGKGWHIRFSYDQPVDDQAPWGRTYGLEFRVTRFGAGATWNPTFYEGKEVPPPENPALLGGSLLMDHSDRIIRLTFEGDLAYSKQNETIRDLVQAHPEWSEEESMGALKKNGARYGPADKEQFIQTVHLDKFERSLGHLEIRLVEFQGLNPDHTGSFAAGSLFWVVQAEGRCLNGTRCTYGFSYEPFAGKLTGVSRIADRSFPSKERPKTQR